MGTKELLLSGCLSQEAIYGTDIQKLLQISACLQIRPRYSMYTVCTGLLEGHSSVGILSINA